MTFTEFASFSGVVCTGDKGENFWEERFTEAGELGERLTCKREVILPAAAAAFFSTSNACKALQKYYSAIIAVSVSLPSVHGPEEERHGDVIPLLCSIFLANQGAGEAAGEGPVLSWDDETALLQGAKEAEKMIVEAYAALLLAFLSTESKSIRNSISECLPGHNLAILVPVLERFVVCIFSMRKLIAGISFDAKHDLIGDPHNCSGSNRIMQVP
ncbi:WAPL (Wings apart-like protein regulation of heterochromatin) protein [Actinidia rufa]|uniref:WAPL (Wings apart-like protein regulation of heterochromatin) protein n=1 Tax=Actinidia rufa TaxID=165716 RepID=A0A7J0FX90_9ERIC|nr:WAPL (Wings apart-like protein regulation of heterochromatin) protein [Actinidia rufa]